MTRRLNNRLDKALTEEGFRRCGGKRSAIRRPAQSATPLEQLKGLKL